jgi:hypothetical protein
VTRIFGIARVLIVCAIGISSVGCLTPQLPLIEGTTCYDLPGLTLQASALQAKIGETVRIEAIEFASEGCPRLNKVTFLLEDQVIAEDTEPPFLKNWILDASVFPTLNQSQYDAPIFARAEYTIQGKKLPFVAGPLLVRVR